MGGSAGTEQTDERENAPDGEVTVAKSADGYTEGIPGPVTRLFVLANRGLANLIQDLILVSFLFLHSKSLSFLPIFHLPFVASKHLFEICTHTQFHSFYLLANCTNK